MRFAIDIPDTVLIELRALSARKGMALDEMVVVLLRLGVASAFRAAAAKEAPKLPPAKPHRRRRRDT